MKNIKNLKTLNNGLLVLFITLATAANPVFGAVPELINFQGKLANSAGTPVTAPVSMVFRFYTTPTSPTPVWTESQEVTPDAYGIYSVLLGSATPFSTFNISFSTAYWLGVAVGTDGEMLPRYQLVSSAYSLYSLNSATAAWAGGADWATITNKSAVTAQGNVFNGASQLVLMDTDGFLPALNGSKLTNMATAALADGSVTTVKLANNAVTDAKVSLSIAAISSGKFGDNRVAISTQAISGGIYNTAGRLVQLGADGFLPVLNGSNLTSLTKAQVGLDSADNTSDAAKPVSTLQQTALNLKANLAGATFTGAISATNLSGSNTGDETAVTIKSALGAATSLADGYLTSADWAAFNDKLAPSGNGSLLTGMSAGQVGLGSVDNTSDAAKPVSTLQQTALNLKANLAGATFTGAISATNLSGSNAGDETAATIKTKLGAATASTDGYLTSVNWGTFNSKLSSTGNGSGLTGLTKAQVGLDSADNTSDAAKPVSTLQQAALNLKANLAGATFTGAISATNLSGSNTGDETAVTIKSALGAATASADGYLTSADWAAFNDKLAPGGNGSLLTGMTAGQVGLGSVDDTSDAAKPVSTLQQTALNLKANLAGATFTGAISATNLSGSNAGDETVATIKTKLGAATALADGYLTSVNWATFNSKLSPTGSGSSLTGLTKAQVGLDNADNTSDAAKPVSTLQQTALNLKANLASPAFTGTVTGITSAMVGLGSANNTADAEKPVSSFQQAALDLKADLTGATFTGAITAPNLSGTNTGDQTTITGNAGTVTNGVYTTGSYADPSWITSLAISKIDLSTVTAAITTLQLTLSTAVYTTGNQTIGGIKTFTSAIAGDITGNAATVTTNANLTGVVTSVGNVTSIGAGVIADGMLANTAVATLSNTNTGDDAVNALYSGLVTNATHTGDATGATALTVVKINGTSLAGLATGILKNTTGTGVPSIAVAVDFPTLNQDTTGNAATATNIAGGSIGQLPYQSGADTTALLAAGTPGQLLQSNGGAAPSWVTPSAGDVVKAGTQTFTGQNTFTSTITAKGYASAVQYVSLNNVSTFAADGSGVVMMTTASGTDAISTITGCNSGDVGQGQNVTFVVAAYTGGTLTFTDTTAAGITTPDAMILSGIATSFAPAASVSSLGATITLLCTTINSTKVWAEVGRSLNGN